MDKEGIRLTRKADIKAELLLAGVSEERAESEAERLSQDHAAVDDNTVIAAFEIDPDGTVIQFTMSSEGLFLMHIDTEHFTPEMLLKLHEVLTQQKAAIEIFKFRNSPAYRAHTGRFAYIDEE